VGRRLFVHLARTAGGAGAFLRRPTVRSEPGPGPVMCQVLVVIGERDFSGPADRLGDALPEAELVVLRCVVHFAAPVSSAA
jgi:hypothetical protein